MPKSWAELQNLSRPSFSATQLPLHVWRAGKIGRAWQTYNEISIHNELMGFVCWYLHLLFAQWWWWPLWYFEIIWLHDFLSEIYVWTQQLFCLRPVSSAQPVESRVFGQLTSLCLEAWKKWQSPHVLMCQSWRKSSGCNKDFKMLPRCYCASLMPSLRKGADGSGRSEVGNV